MVGIGRAIRRSRTRYPRHPHSVRTPHTHTSNCHRESRRSPDRRPLARCTDSHTPGRRRRFGVAHSVHTRPPSIVMGTLSRSFTRGGGCFGLETVYMSVEPPQRVLPDSRDWRAWYRTAASYSSGCPTRTGLSPRLAEPFTPIGTVYRPVAHAGPAGVSFASELLCNSNTATGQRYSRGRTAYLHGIRYTSRASAWVCSRTVHLRIQLIQREVALSISALPKCLGALEAPRPSGRSRPPDYGIGSIWTVLDSIGVHLTAPGAAAGRDPSRTTP